MIGEMFAAWMTTDAPLRVIDAALWPWTGAGVHQSSQIAGVYGIEADRRFDNGQQPANVQVLGNALVEEYTGGTTPAPGIRASSSWSRTCSRASPATERWGPRRCGR